MSVLATHLSPTHAFTKLPQRSITLLQGLGVKGDVHCGKKTQHEIFIILDKKKGELRDNIRQVHLIQAERFDEEGFCRKDGQRLRPGEMGENITTIGIDLLSLGKGTKLRFVDDVDVSRHAQNTPIARYMLLGRLVQDLCAAGIFIGMGAFRADRTYWAAAITVLIGFLAFRLVHQDRKTSQGEVAVISLTGRRRPCNKIDKYIGPGMKDDCIVKDGNDKTIGHRAGVMGIVESGGLVKSGMRIIAEPAEIFEELPAV